MFSKSHIYLEEALMIFLLILNSGVCKKSELYFNASNWSSALIISVSINVLTRMPRDVADGLFFSRILYKSGKSSLQIRSSI